MPGISSSTIFLIAPMLRGLQQLSPGETIPVVNESPADSLQHQIQPNTAEHSTFVLVYSQEMEKPVKKQKTDQSSDVQGIISAVMGQDVHLFKSLTRTNLSGKQRFVF